MADTAHSFLLPTEDREHPYPDSPSDPNKRKGKTFPAPAESALDVLRAGPKPRKRCVSRPILRRGARLRRESASSDRSTPGAWRLFFKVGAGTAATSAALPPPQDEISPRNNLETHRAARRDGFDTCGLPRGFLGDPGAARSGHVPGYCLARACQDRHSRAKRGRRTTRPTPSKKSG